MRYFDGSSLINSCYQTGDSTLTISDSSFYTYRMTLTPSRDRGVPKDSPLDYIAMQYGNEIEGESKPSEKAKPASDVSVNENSLMTVPSPTSGGTRSLHLAWGVLRMNRGTPWSGHTGTGSS